MKNKNTNEKRRLGHSIAALAIGSCIFSAIQTTQTGTSNVLREQQSTVFSLGAATLSATNKAKQQWPKASDKQLAAFEKLELFVTTFPGNSSLKDINGFADFEAAFVKSVQFFWPMDFLTATVVLDDNVHGNSKEERHIEQQVKQMFHAETSPRIKMRCNPRSNKTAHGRGWMMQQLIMLWADNFATAECIGFVDDDTLFARTVQPEDLFDENGRPRVIGSAPGRYREAAEFTFQRRSKVFAMSCFPVIVKRAHLALLRKEILRIHSDCSYFDEFYLKALSKDNDKDDFEFSQFCVMMDYIFHHYPDEYTWHMDVNTTILATNSSDFTAAQTLPFPRVAVHGSYVHVSVKKMRASRTPKGRKEIVSGMMREGYFNSLPVWNDTAENRRRCESFQIATKTPWHARDYRFEQLHAGWMKFAVPAVQEAHAAKLARLEPRAWNETELSILFAEHID